MSDTDDAIRPSASMMGDLFEDSAGKRWRLIGYNALPTVVLESEEDLLVRVTASTDSEFVHGLRLVDDD